MHSAPKYAPNRSGVDAARDLVDSNILGIDLLVRGELHHGDVETDVSFAARDLIAVELVDDHLGVSKFRFRARNRWRTSGPPLKGVVERADLAVPKEEGDLRDAEVALLKISARQFLPKAFNNTVERCIQVREFAR